MILNRNCKNIDIDLNTKKIGKHLKGSKQKVSNAKD